MDANQNLIEGSIWSRIKLEALDKVQIDGTVVKNAKSPKLIQSSGKHWPQYLAVLLASLSYFTRGIHTAWTSPALPKLLNQTNSTATPFVVTSTQASWIVVSYFQCIAIGGPIAALLIHMIGRKKVILLSAIPHLLSFILIAIATSAEYLYVARALAGISEGLSNIAGPVYVGEIAQPEIRGILGAIISVAVIFGMLAINVIGSYTSILTSSIICAIFPILLLLLFTWMPETPYYLVMKRRTEKAKVSLQRLRGIDDVEDELNAIKISVEKQSRNVGTFRDLFFIRSNRRALIVAMGMELVQQCSGISAILAYTQIIFRQSGQEMSSEMSAIIITAIQLISSVFAINFVDRWGRKPLLMISTAGCAIALILEGIYLYLQYINFAYLADINWLPLTALIMYIAIYSVGLAILLNVLLSELFAANIKGKALGVNIILYGLISFIVSKFFQMMTDQVGMFFPFFVYAFCCICGFVFIYFYVPETKGKTLQDIQEWFMQK